MNLTRLHLRPVHARLLMIAIVTAVLPAWADRILFNHGRTLEGVIVEESETAIVLDLGAGRTTIPRSRIKAIERDAERNSEVEEGWADRYFLHDRYVPPSEKATADAFKALQQQREAAIKARRDLASSDQRELALQRAIAAGHAEHTRIGRELQQIDPKQELRAYNTRVTDMSEVAARINRQALQLQGLPRAREAARATLMTYFEALTRFEQHLMPLAPAASPDVTTFRERVMAACSHMLDEFVTADAKVTFDGRHHRVQARLNHRATGTFMLDSGASVVTLSRAAAQRAGIDLQQMEPTSVTLADGRDIDAHRATLALLEIGETRLTDVAVIVMPTPPSDTLDGLLGMNVLRQFVMRVGANGTELDLRQFQPREP